MQVAVGPADGDLKDGVQPVELGVAWHLQPPLDGRLAAEQDNLQLVDRGTAFPTGAFNYGIHALNDSKLLFFFKKVVARFARSSGDLNKLVTRENGCGKLMGVTNKATGNPI